MKLTHLWLSALVLTPILALAEPEIKGTPSELAQVINGIRKNIVISGEAEVRLPASRAIVNLTVVTENASLQEALRANADARARVSASLKQEGIAPEKIQAARFSSTPKFGLWGNKAKSYRVENAMRISVQEERELRSVAKVVDTMAEVSFAGVEFEYADRETAKAKAIAQACDQAESRKKIYEEHLNLQLTPVRFSEDSVAANETTAPARRESDGYSLSRASTTEEAPSSFGEMVFTAKVAVEYLAATK